MKNKKLRIMTESAVMLALSVVLSFVKLWEMPMGGSVTLVSMLPIFVCSVRRGVKTGCIVGFLFALFNLASAFAQGNVFVYCTGAATLFVVIVFDYLIPFTGLGLAGIFCRHSAVFQKRRVYFGVIFAVILRFICHYMTGITVWGQWADGQSPYLYSLLYNGGYLLPELLLTTAAVFALLRVPQTKKIFSASEND